MNPSIQKLLFSAASGLVDPAERSAFLDYACRNDPKLRTQVDELLAIQQEADTFFEFEPEVLPEGDACEKTEESFGAHIGRYRLITRIGAGGCGVVYYAEQEEPVRRKVALKIIKLGMDTEAVIARFELERQALAQMDHPNIARVLDAGATGSGRPYFVMELVEGDRITDFCDANHYSIRQRLELFVQVCSAIQHAHQKGLIHRDIKPSNILVRLQDGVPVPKVIDFGIAKATAGNPGINGTFTQADQFLGTPAYISPEQARGSADVDTRSDIYSLGVLLYELLSGQLPFDLQRLTAGAVDEARRIIRDEEPKAPASALKKLSADERAVIAANRATTVPYLAARLAGDLGWIVMKAMERERTRRYQTALGLAAEVSRYLNDEIVSARPPSRMYRLGKLVRRNKVAFAAGSVALLGLLGGFSFSTWMFLRERSARLEQARLREKAEIRELVADAAVKVKYGEYEQADNLLAQVPVEETPSSLEAADAFAAIADWHAHAGRLKEAAARFSSMINALSTVDTSDIPEVSLNLLPVAATVAYTGDAARYEDIRAMAIARFGTTSNPQVAEQTLKACLLLPADKKTLDELAPLADLVEAAIDSKEGTIGQSPYNSAWACFASSLWHYRLGEFSRAAERADQCLASPDKNEVRATTMLIVRAMIEQQSGEPEKASESLAQARSTVHNAFSTDKWITAPWPEIWFDWINAAILLVEAERVIGSD